MKFTEQVLEELKFIIILLSHPSCASWPPPYREMRCTSHLFDESKLGLVAPPYGGISQVCPELTNIFGEGIEVRSIDRERDL